MKLLGTNEKLVISINSIFTLSNVLSSMFLNVYLFTYTQSMVVMAIYTSIRIGLFPISEYLAALLAKRKGYTCSIMLGLMMIMSSLIFTLTMGDRFALYPNLVYVVAVLTGIGEGCYYLCINTLNQKCTTSKTRAHYLAMMGVVTNLGNLVGPFISTMILSKSINDLTGYTTIFKVILIFYLFILVLCWFVKVEKEKQILNLRGMFQLKKDYHWAYCCKCSLLNGIRDVFPLALSGLMVYEATGGDGTSYSQLLSLFSIITIASCLALKNCLSSHRWLHLYHIGAWITTGSMLAMLIFNNLYGAILYGVLNALSVATFSNPFTMDFMNIINRYEDGVMARLIVKETFLSIGRVGSMLLIAILSFIIPTQFMNIGVLVAAISPLWLIYLVRQYHHEIHNFKRTIGEKV